MKPCCLTYIFELSAISELSMYYCNISSELEGDFCDPENIRSDRHLIKKCENWNDKENTFCEVQCRPNYILEGTSTSTCVNGSLSPVRCVLRSELVLHCEDTRLVSYLQLLHRL